MNEIRLAAPELLTKLFHALDSCDYDTLVACFAETGSWTRQGKTLKGQAEIRDALVARPTTLSTIHIANNILIDEVSTQSAAARFYLTAYRYNSPSPPPYPVPLPAAVGLCKAAFGCDGQSWRLNELQTGPYVFAN